MTQDPAKSDKSNFAAQAEEAAPGLLREFADFLLFNKKWWLTPIIVVLFLLAVLFVFGPAVPYLYTFF